MKKKKSYACFALLLLFFTGCGSNSETDHSHSHEEGGLQTLSYTIYSDKLELFVEFKPLIVGSLSKFAAHFTILGESFQPLSQGKVTVSLIVADKGIKNHADEPSAPGIYRLALSPVTGGTGKLVFDIQTEAFTDQIIIDNIKVYPDERSAIEDIEEEDARNEITYLKEQAWKIEFASIPLKKTSFSEIIKTGGQILPAPGDEMLITANARGIVLFSGNKTITGSEVSPGTKLFTIAAGNITEGNVEVAYMEAKANLDKAKSDYERSKTLVKDKIISEKDFLEAKLKLENTQSVFNAIAKNYTSGGQTVTAPMNGYIKNILVSEGQFVEAGSPLATISGNKKLILQVNVSQKYFGKLSSVTSANFKTTGNENFKSTSELNGKLVSYGKSADPSMPFIPITFEIDNTGNLIPGSVAEVYLELLPLTDVLAVPVSSLIEEQGSFFVYVQTGGESFQKREVKTGASDGINVQLLSGVIEGERVVTKGAYQIKLSSMSGTMPSHGHEH